MADVFISYSSKNRDRVSPIVAALESCGYSVWWDTRIDVGTSFDRNIEAELDDAKCVVVVWSKESVESEWVLNEAADGLDRRVLVPVRIDDVRLPLAFRRLQTADLVNPSAGGLEKALAGVSRVLGESEPPASVGVPQNKRTRLVPFGMIISGAILVSVLALVVWLNPFVDDVGTASGSANRVAVLPFRDLSPDGGLQWLADGLQIRLTQIIGSSTSHRIIPTPLASRLIEDGSMEEIDLLISGTLQQEGDSIRTTVELTEVESKRQLWNQTFAGRDGNLFEYQQALASQVARYFSTSLEDDTVPTEPEAWNPYLRYLHYQWGGAFDEEVYWLQKTLEADPGWSNGWFALSIQLTRRAAVLKAQRWIEQAVFAADRACETSSVDHPACKMSTADIAMWVEGDLDKAERIYRSLPLDQGRLFFYGMLMLYSGLPSEAERLFERLTEIDPLLPMAHDWLSASRGISGDLAGSLEAANEFRRLIPGDTVVADLNRGIVAAKLGMISEADDLAHRLQDASEDARNGSDFESFTQFGADLIKAKLSTLSEDPVRATQLASQFAQRAPAFAAAVYLETGDERAERLLQEAAMTPEFHRRSAHIFLLYLDRNLHGHPAVKDFLDALGQTQEWREELCTRVQKFEGSMAMKCKGR